MSEKLNLNVEQINFLGLIATYAAAGWSALGKIPNPMTNKLDRNLEHAKNSIDILELLREKTKGNLTEEEEKYLDASIADLQINYLQEKTRG
ncbi:MAG: DUF1844 domain-containing protein [Cyanobacteriota bacterium]